MRREARTHEMSGRSRGHSRCMAAGTAIRRVGLLPVLGFWIGVALLALAAAPAPLASQHHPNLEKGPPPVPLRASRALHG